MTETATLIDLITQGGLLSALILALIGGQRGWYVWGTHHTEVIRSQKQSYDEALKEKNVQLEDLQKDRNYWRDHAMRVLSTTDRAVGVYEASTRRSE